MSHTWKRPSDDEIKRMGIRELGQLLEAATQEMPDGPGKDQFTYHIEEKIDRLCTYPEGDEINAMDLPTLFGELNRMQALPPTPVCEGVVYEVFQAITKKKPTDDQLDEMQIPELAALLQAVKAGMPAGSGWIAFVNDVEVRIDELSDYPLPSQIRAMDATALCSALETLKALPPTRRCRDVIGEIQETLDDLLGEQEWTTTKRTRGSPSTTKDATTTKRTRGSPSTTKDAPVEISDDDGPSESRPRASAAPPLPRLPPRDPSAQVPRYEPYRPNEYLSRRWIGAYSRIRGNGNVERHQNFTTVSVAYVCEIQFKEPVRGQERESNAVASLRDEHGWLTDEVINGCMGLMNNRQEAPSLFDDELTPRCIFADSYFNKLMIKDNGDCDLRKATHMNFAEADLLIVPINCSGAHWVLMVAYLRQKQIIVYNSHRSRFTHYQAQLETYLNAVGKARGLEFLQGPWEKDNVIPPAIPFQPDGWNCGLFTIAAADCIARGRPPSGYNADDMPRMRREILRFLGFDP